MSNAIFAAKEVEVIQIEAAGAAKKKSITVSFVTYKRPQIKRCGHAWMV